MSSRRIVRWITGALLVVMSAALVAVAVVRVRQKRPNHIEMDSEPILGQRGDEALGVSNEFKILERVQGKLIFVLEAIRTLGMSSGWQDIETVAVQLYKDDESEGPLVTCQRAQFNPETKNANLSGNIQVEFPDGTFLSTEVGALLDGGRRFETGTNVVFVGEALVGSAGSASYDIGSDVLVLSHGVIVRTEDGDSLVAPQVTYRKNAHNLWLDQGGRMTFGTMTVEASKGRIDLEEEGLGPTKVVFSEGVSIVGHEAGRGQEFQAQCRRLEARRDSADRWQISATSPGPWVRFITLGGRDVVFQELLAWEVSAVAGAKGLLSVRADGRVCLKTIPLEGPGRTGEGDSVRVWFEDGSATDLELIDNVVLAGNGVTATAHRARLDAGSGRVMLHGNPTSDDRVVIVSDQGRITADQAVLFRESGRADIIGRVQGEMYGQGPHILGDRRSDDEKEPVHIAADTVRVTDNATVFDLSDQARVWQGNRLLTGDDIHYVSTNNEVTARGHVRTTLPASALGDDSQSGQDVVLSARSLDYSEADGKAVFSGDVEYKDATHSMNAGKVEIFMTPTNDVEKIIATGAVSIKEPGTGRVMTGNKAVREIGDGRLLLTGEPARAVDESGNMLSGLSLTWDQANGTVTVSAETETIYHTTEEEF